MQVLSEVLLGLCGPSRKVGPKSSDVLPNDVKGAILLIEAGPEMLWMVVSGNGRKALKLLNRHRSLGAIELESQGTVRLPRDFPVSFKAEG